MYGVRAAGSRDGAGVLAHVRKRHLLDDQIAVVLKADPHIVALGRLAIAGGPDHLVVADILILLQQQRFIIKQPISTYVRQSTQIRFQISSVRGVRLGVLPFQTKL
jgi:hypothetical protein